MATGEKSEADDLIQRGVFTSGGRRGDRPGTTVASVGKLGSGTGLTNVLGTAISRGNCNRVEGSLPPEPL